jgi:hypothetical protein
MLREVPRHEHAAVCRLAPNDRSACPVYGVLSLSPPKFSMDADYTATVEEVFQRATAAIVHHDRTLEILVHGGRSVWKSDRPGLPSWAVDFSISARSAPTSESADACLALVTSHIGMADHLSGVNTINTRGQYSGGTSARKASRRIRSGVSWSGHTRLRH